MPLRIIVWESQVQRAQVVSHSDRKLPIGIWLATARIGRCTRLAFDLIQQELMFLKCH